MLTKAEISRLRSLREKKHREAAGLFVAEGEKVVRELLAAGFVFEEILVTEGLASVLPTTEPTRVITDLDMERISHFPTPSTVFAVGRLNSPAWDPSSLDQGLTLALDGVQDAGNVGTLLRIADWYGLDRVLLSPDCADLFHQKVINASMGSFARVAAFRTSLPEALANVSVPVLGCDLQGQDVHTVRELHAAVIVVGSEGRGLSPAVRERISHFVTIPRYGGAESLNAAIAAAIVCDHVRRIGASPQTE